MCTYGLRTTRTVLILLLGAVGAAHAADPCDGFKWNVSHERALFTGSAHLAAAGDHAASAPRVIADRLYSLRLHAQDRVRFAAPPGKKPRQAAAFGGLLRMRVPLAGSYRISVDQPAWIDVLDGDETIRSEDFQGSTACPGPHKIVLFSLPAGHELILQLSRSPNASMRLAVTPAPASTSTPAVGSPGVSFTPALAD